MSKRAALAKRVLDYVLEFDTETISASVARMRQKKPAWSSRQLAKQLINGAAWRATLSGAVAGAPANPLLALPLAGLDVYNVFTTELGLAAHIALLYDDAFFDTPNAKYILLVPILGVNVFSQRLADAGIAIGGKVTRKVIEEKITDAAWKKIEAFLLEYFGKKIARDAIVEKAVPIIGALISAGWNHAELRIVGGRIIAYFEGRESPETGVAV